ncbi:hypothetical protein D3C85_1251460 [compost metagenome]
MAATDPLFDTLGIPGQVVVHHQRAELQVDAFRPSLGGDHYGAEFLEMLDQRGAGVGGFRAADAITAFMALEPVLIDGLGAGIAIGAVEQHYACAIGSVF